MPNGWGHNIIKAHSIEVSPEEPVAGQDFNIEGRVELAIALPKDGRGIITLHILRGDRRIHTEARYIDIPRGTKVFTYSFTASVDAPGRYTAYAEAYVSADRLTGFKRSNTVEFTVVAKPEEKPKPERGLLDRALEFIERNWFKLLIAASAITGMTATIITLTKRR